MDSLRDYDPLDFHSRSEARRYMLVKSIQYSKQYNQRNCYDK